MPDTKKHTQQFVRSRKNHVTIASFSLTNEAKEDLRKHLEPYVKREKQENAAELADIVNNSLGAPIIEELRALKSRTQNTDTVFVIHNLPELPDEGAKKIFKGLRNSFAGVEKLPNTYNYYISMGIAEALGLYVEQEFCLVRKRNWPVAGYNYHNHNSNDVSALAGVVSDGAETSFLNLKALTQDAKASEIKAHNTDDELKITMPLTELAGNNAWINGKRGSGFAIEEDGKKRIMNKYRRSIAADKGDLVLWSERGNLMHKALLSDAHNASHTPDEILRVIGVYGLNQKS